MTPVHHKHDHEEDEEIHEVHEAPVEQHRRHVGFVRRMLIAIVSNLGALVAVLYFVDGITFAPDIDTFRLQLKTVIVAGILIGLANGILKPIFKFFTFPFIILSLGLLLLAINWFIFWLVVHQFPGLVVTGGFAAYFWGSLLFSIVNTLEHWFLGAKRH